MMNMVPPHDGIGVIFNPNAGQCISADLIILIISLCKISDVQANIFAVADVAMFNKGIGPGAAHANSCANWKKKKNG